MPILHLGKRKSDRTYLIQLFTESLAVLSDVLHVNPRDLGRFDASNELLRILCSLMEGCITAFAGPTVGFEASRAIKSRIAAVTPVHFGREKKSKEDNQQQPEPHAGGGG